MINLLFQVEDDRTLEYWIQMKKDENSIPNYFQTNGAAPLR
jgi:hypothetical protein